MNKVIKSNGMLALVDCGDHWLVQLPTGKIQFVIWEVDDEAKKIAKKVYKLLIKEGIC
jgi:hypothetical protein